MQSSTTTNDVEGLNAYFSANKNGLCQCSSSICQHHSGPRLERQEPTNWIRPTGIPCQHLDAPNLISNPSPTKRQFSNPTDIQPRPPTVSTIRNAADDSTVAGNRSDLIQEQFQNPLGLSPSVSTMAHSIEEPFFDTQSFNRGVSISTGHPQLYATDAGPSVADLLRMYSSQLSNYGASLEAGSVIGPLVERVLSTETNGMRSQPHHPVHSGPSMFRIPTSSMDGQVNTTLTSANEHRRYQGSMNAISHEKGSIVRNNVRQMDPVSLPPSSADEWVSSTSASIGYLPDITRSPSNYRYHVRRSNEERTEIEAAGSSRSRRANYDHADSLEMSSSRSQEHKPPSRLRPGPLDVSARDPSAPFRHARGHRSMRIRDRPKAQISSGPKRSHNPSPSSAARLDHGTYAHQGASHGTPISVSAYPQAEELYGPVLDGHSQSPYVADDNYPALALRQAGISGGLHDQPSSGSGGHDANVSQLPELSTALAENVNQDADARLYPTLDSPFVLRLKKSLPYPLPKWFTSIRPSDKWQLIIKTLHHQLDISAETLDGYDDVEFAQTLEGLCETRLHRVVRGGCKGGVTVIQCAIQGCTKQFEKQNVSRNFAHHVMKDHWEINPFLCRSAECSVDFAWPDDRTRHEKDHQDLVL